MGMFKVQFPRIVTVRSTYISLSPTRMCVRMTKRSFTLGMFKVQSLGKTLDLSFGSLLLQSTAPGKVVLCVARIPKIFVCR